MKTGDPGSSVHSVQTSESSQANGAARPRWLLPAVIGSVVAGGFLLATRPAPTEETAAPTTAPPAIAAVDIGPHDLRTPLEEGLISDWFQATINMPAAINDIVRTSSSFIAVGGTSTEPQAWVSGTGGSWQPVGVVEAPDDASSGLDVVTMWNGHPIALGYVGDRTGVWTAPNHRRWSYHGVVEEIGTNRIGFLTAGPELLAMTHGLDGSIQAWTSNDGTSWSQIDALTGLEDIPSGISAIAGTSYGYVLTVWEQPTEGVSVWVSPDAIDWSRTELSSAMGVTTHLAAADDAVYVTGLVGDDRDSSLAVWKTTDGQRWGRLGVDHPALQSAATTVSVNDIELGAEATATIDINGTEYLVAIGSEVLTDTVSVVIDTINAGRLVVVLDGEPTTMEVGESLSLSTYSIPYNIAAEGSRIIVTGIRHGSTRLDITPTVWSSPDGGETWHRSAMPDSIERPGTTLIADTNVIVLNAASSSNEAIWRSTWNPEVQRANAVDVVEAYVDALNRTSAEGLIAILPESLTGHAERRFHIPSLGQTEHDWWGENDTLDPAALAETMGYLRGLETELELGECVSTTRLGTNDRVELRCPVSATSAISRLLDADLTAGELVAVVRNGELEMVGTSIDPSEVMWQTLATSAAFTSAEERSTLVADGEGLPETRPVFTRATIDTHVHLAERFEQGLLRPGDVAIVATPVGTMEWSWVDFPASPAGSLSAITWSELGFVVVDSGARKEILISTDGRDWERVPFPEGVEWMSALQPYGSGVVAEAQGTFPDATLAFFDGADWTLLPVGFRNQWSGGLSNLAVSDGRVLTLAGYWDDENKESTLGLTLVEDLDTVTQLKLPPRSNWLRTNVEIAGTTDGFILSAMDTSPDNVAVVTTWSSLDGESWTLLTEDQELPGARYLRGLEATPSELFVTGSADETLCFATGNGGRRCESPNWLWTSIDGRQWNRVDNQFGGPVTSDHLAIGPLGMVGVEYQYESTSALQVHLSSDGTQWTQLELTILPTTSAIELAKPAVSDDTIIIPGGELRNPRNDGAPIPFLIVGRLIES